MIVNKSNPQLKKLQIETSNYTNRITDISEKINNIQTWVNETNIAIDDLQSQIRHQDERINNIEQKPVELHNECVSISMLNDLVDDIQQNLNMLNTQTPRNNDAIASATDKLTEIERRLQQVESLPNVTNVSERSIPKLKLQAKKA